MDKKKITMKNLHIESLVKNMLTQMRRFAENIFLFELNL